MNPENILHDLPLGSFEGTAHGKRYRLSKLQYAGGASLKLVAEAADGSDYISLNLYQLASGPRLFPCEMPLEKVLAFLKDLRV